MNSNRTVLIQTEFPLKSALTAASLSLKNDRSSVLDSSTYAQHATSFKRKDDTEPLASHGLALPREYRL